MQPGLLAGTGDLGVVAPRHGTYFYLGDSTRGALCAAVLACRRCLMIVDPSASRVLARNRSELGRAPLRGAECCPPPLPSPTSISATTAAQPRASPRRHGALTALCLCRAAHSNGISTNCFAANQQTCRARAGATLVGLSTTNGSVTCNVAVRPPRHRAALAPCADRVLFVCQLCADCVLTEGLCRVTCSLALLLPPWRAPTASRR